MRKGFMMIEISLILLGLFMLVSVTLRIYQEVLEGDFSYEFVQVSKKCDIKCAIKKLTP
jgi:hypothetical protein